MSKYVWLAAVALVALSAGILFWVDRASDEPKTRALPPGPQRMWRQLDAGERGGEGRPHFDRAGLPRSKLIK